MKQTDGFKGQIILVDRQSGKGLGMSFWESEDLSVGGGLGGQDLRPARRAVEDVVREAAHLRVAALAGVGVERYNAHALARESEETFLKTGKRKTKNETPRPRRMASAAPRNRLGPRMKAGTATNRVTVDTFVQRFIFVLLPTCIERLFTPLP